MISRERWQRIEPFVDTAMDLPANELPAYLDGVCPSEPEMSEDIRRLVAILREQRDGGGSDEGPLTPAGESPPGLSMGSRYHTIKRACSGGWFAA